MSGIPIIGKVFDLLDDVPILKAVAIGAAIYFTVGAVSSAFTSAGATTAAAGGTAAATTAANVGAATAAPGIAGITAGAGAATVAPTVAGTSVFGTALPAAAPVVAGAGTVAAATAPAATSWFAANPMATMMLGQGVMGAAAGVSAEESRKAEEAERERERKERGLFGFDWEGKRAGVVGDAMTPQTPDQTIAAQQAPIVASQQVAAPVQTTAQQVPIQRKDLPKLKQAGQLG